MTAPALTRSSASRERRVATPLGVGLVTRAQSGGGVAYVGRLLERAVAELTGEPPWVAELAPARVGSVSALERVRFAARLLRAQSRRTTGGVLFNHVGVARAQRWIPRGVRQPYGVFLHGVEVWDPSLGADRQAALRAARLRIANSHYTARRTEGVHPGIGPVMPCPLALLPDASDEPMTPRPGLDAAAGESDVLIVGRLSAAERYKGHDELIECWPAVVAAVPSARLLVVGQGDDADRLRRKATEAGLGDRVVFRGYLADADVRSLMARVALFAMPSRGEGFGLVYLEAMRAGLACVASTDDAARDVIEDGRTGLLVAQQDRRALASAIVALLQDHARRRAMGAAGRRRFEAEFTFPSFVRRLGDVLGQAFDGPGTRKLTCAE